MYLILKCPMQIRIARTIRVNEHFMFIALHGKTKKPRKKAFLNYFPLSLYIVITVREILSIKDPLY